MMDIRTVNDGVLVIWEWKDSACYIQFLPRNGTTGWAEMMKTIPMAKHMMIQVLLKTLSQKVMTMIV